jgi:hypothetical protein
VLVIVQPETLIRWHWQGFWLFLHCKSRPGRRRLPADLRTLIRRMARRNPTWGEERIANERLLHAWPAGCATDSAEVHTHASTPRSGSTPPVSALADLCPSFAYDGSSRRARYPETLTSTNCLYSGPRPPHLSGPTGLCPLPCWLLDGDP